MGSQQSPDFEKSIYTLNNELMWNMMGQTCRSLTFSGSFVRLAELISNIISEDVQKCSLDILNMPLTPYTALLKCIIYYLFAFKWMAIFANRLKRQTKEFCRVLMLQNVKLLKSSKSILYFTSRGNFCPSKLCSDPSDDALHFPQWKVILLALNMVSDPPPLT